MKKRILIAIAAAIPFLGFKYSDDLQKMGLNFSAPTVIDKSSIFNPSEGDIIYEASPTGRKFYGRDDAGWVQLSAGESIIPSGIILPFGGTTAPQGYAFARGQALLIADYPDLYAAIVRLPEISVHFDL